MTWLWGLLMKLEETPVSERFHSWWIP